MKLLHKPILALALLLLAATAAQAQQQPQAKRPYPSSEPLPADLVWMREVYRTLDLTKDANGALYFPTEPQGDRMNLFTTIFRLLAQNKIPAYEYQLDGTEHFQESYKTTFRDVLDRFQIYYELKRCSTAATASSPYTTATSPRPTYKATSSRKCGTSTSAPPPTAPP